MANNPHILLSDHKYALEHLFEAINRYGNLLNKCHEELRALQTAKAFSDEFFTNIGQWDDGVRANSHHQLCSRSESTKSAWKS